nr:hypothetical protein [Cardiobacterium valvarum]
MLLSIPLIFVRTVQENQVINNDLRAVTRYAFWIRVLAGFQFSLNPQAVAGLAILTDDFRHLAECHQTVPLGFSRFCPVC